MQENWVLRCSFEKERPQAEQTSSNCKDCKEIITIVMFSCCNFVVRCSFQHLRQILCLQVMVSSMSKRTDEVAKSIKSQQTSQRHSSSANCSSTMKLFSEQILGLGATESKAPPLEKELLSSFAVVVEAFLVVLVVVVVVENNITASYMKKMKERSEKESLFQYLMDISHHTGLQSQITGPKTTKNKILKRKLFWSFLMWLRKLVSVWISLLFTLYNDCNC